MSDKIFVLGADGLTPLVKVGLSSSSGAGDAGKIPALDTTGRLDSTFMPVGVNQEVDTIPATENLAAGDFVNIYASNGIKCRKADATTAGKEANGFVLSAVTSPANATVYRISQSNTQLSGMIPGVKQFLATTAGGRTETVPSASGNVIQCLGIAKSATELIFMPSDPIVLA
jgi:hypothetical protein